MTEQMRERMDTAQLVLEILREHGLVVVALAALVWQVWFTAEMQLQNQDRWRVVIDGFRDELRSMRESRTDYVKELSDRMLALEKTCMVVTNGRQ
jgi:hypothetical protein